MFPDSCVCFFLNQKHDTDMHNTTTYLFISTKLKENSINF